MEVRVNNDTVKGALQKVGGHVEEAAGALVGDHNLKEAGREDQIKGGAREAWGNVKDAGNALIDKAKAAKFDAEENLPVRKHLTARTRWHAAASECSCRAVKQGPVGAPALFIYAASSG
jgi:uncharacterized protein YjbJ (UPF0337 family)